ncbi:MAG: hypothetical protein ACMUIA_08975, partial [bacterium]
MKKFLVTFISICFSLVSSFALAGVTRITLNSVPNDLECDEECLCDKSWVVSDIVLSVTSTETDEVPCNDGCSWEHDENFFGPIYDNGILLNPGRLTADLSSLDDPITKIEVYLEDYCPNTGGCCSAAIYEGSKQIAKKTSQSDSGPINESGHFIFDQTNSGISTVDKLNVSSC